MVVQKAGLMVALLVVHWVVWRVGPKESLWVVWMVGQLVDKKAGLKADWMVE